MRVSGDAIEKAVAAAEDYIARLAREAHALAVADKRKTIMESDIVQARARVPSAVRALAARFARLAHSLRVPRAIGLPKRSLR